MEVHLVELCLSSLSKLKVGAKPCLLAQSYGLPLCTIFPSSLSTLASAALRIVVIRCEANVLLSQGGMRATCNLVSVLGNFARGGIELLSLLDTGTQVTSLMGEESSWIQILWFG